MSLSALSPTLKKQLGEATALNAKWQEVQREWQQVTTELNVLQLDQERIRENLRETPKEAEVYSKYLDKLSGQEKEIDRLTDRLKNLTQEVFAARKKYEDFLANLSD